MQLREDPERRSVYALEPKRCPHRVGVVTGIDFVSEGQTLSAPSRLRALDDCETGRSCPALPNPCAGMFP